MSNRPMRAEFDNIAVVEDGRSERRTAVDEEAELSRPVFLQFGVLKKDIHEEVRKGQVSEDDDGAFGNFGDCLQSSIVSHRDIY